MEESGAADHKMTTPRRVQSLEQHRGRRRAEPLIPEVVFELRSAGVVVRHLDDPADAEMWREAGWLVADAWVVMSAPGRLDVVVRIGTASTCGWSTLTTR